MTSRLILAFAACAALLLAVLAGIAIGETPIAPAVSVPVKQVVRPSESKASRSF